MCGCAQLSILFKCPSIASTEMHRQNFSSSSLVCIYVRAEQTSVPLCRCVYICFFCIFLCSQSIFVRDFSLSLLLLLLLLWLSFCLFSHKQKQLAEVYCVHTDRTLLSRVTWFERETPKKPNINNEMNQRMNWCVQKLNVEVEFSFRVLSITALPLTLLMGFFISRSSACSWTFSKIKKKIYTF